MTSSKLRERLARLGPLRDVSPPASGSRLAVVLRPAGDRGKLKTIDATRLLVAQGLSMSKAKRGVEVMAETGSFAVELPAVSSFRNLLSGLGKAGISVSRLATDRVDVRGLRESLHLTQEQFALRYRLSIDAVQHWEQGTREPDTAANNYLRVIKAAPELAARAQEETG